MLESAILFCFHRRVCFELRDFWSCQCGHAHHLYVIKCDTPVCHTCATHTYDRVKPFNLPSTHIDLVSRTNYKLLTLCGLCIMVEDHFLSLGSTLERKWRHRLTHRPSLVKAIHWRFSSISYRSKVLVVHIRAKYGPQKGQCPDRDCVIWVQIVKVVWLPFSYERSPEKQEQKEEKNFLLLYFTHLPSGPPYVTYDKFAWHSGCPPKVLNPCVKSHIGRSRVLGFVASHF